MPRHCEERLLRVYLKRDVECEERRKYTEAVRIAFRNYLRRVGLDGQVHSPVLTSFANHGKGTEYNPSLPNARFQLAALRSSFSSPPEQTVPLLSATDEGAADELAPSTKRTRQFFE